MSISINISFEELLKIISSLNSEEKRKISEVLNAEKTLTKEQFDEAISRKKAFEKGDIQSESWEALKNRLIN